VTSPIAQKLLRWYSSRQRYLPWRQRPIPYRVWVAEIMAQQTRLESMLPYYRRWLRRFPTIKSLAKAREQDVLSLWEGLGYYSRARNLRKAARIVAKEHGGRLPSTFEELLALPGIGRYTAGAIASLAFGADVPAVDGNAIRVLARVFNVQLIASSSAAQARFWSLAVEHLPPGQAAAYNQAVMDLGAEICTPRNPQCTICPLKRNCLAKALNVQEQRPVKSQTKSVPVRHLAALVIRDGNRVLVEQRPGRGLLAGMWAFPNAPVKNAGLRRSRAQRLLRDLGFPSGLAQHLGDFEHKYSHFTARVCAFHIALNGSKPAIRSERKYKWVSINKLDMFPMGKLDRTIAKALRLL
jgi:A/G-specific adenine glycosylase